MVLDVTNKANVSLLSTTPYENLAYATQGWLTDDHRYFLLTDEVDELAEGIDTTVYIFDVTNLTSPAFSSKWVSDLPATDHTVYVRGNYAFLAAYSSGLRILDLTNIDQKQITEAGYFDTFDPHNNPGYSGVRNIYPFYPSGVVVTSGTGLHILHPDARFTR